MYRKLCMAVCLFFVFTVLSTPFSYAHEMWSTSPHRWYDVHWSDEYLHSYVFIKANGSLLDSGYSSAYAPTLYNWNFYSNNYATVSDTSFSDSDVDFAARATWPSTWTANAAARTLCYDAQGDCYCVLPGSSVNVSCSRELERAEIWTNKKFNTDPNYTIQVKKFVLAHEFGHVLGLGHPGDTTQSVLHTNTLPGWSSYEKPKSHDRSDLASFY